MHIHIIAIGDRMPDWVGYGYKEYVKRLPTQYQPKLYELASVKRTKNSNLNRILEIESKKIKSAIPPGSHVIALDQPGKAIATEDLVNSLREWSLSGLNIAMLIGGPDGLSETCIQEADEQWSLSRMTLPHQMVRIIIAEQLYRAWSILNKMPYHR